MIEVKHLKKQFGGLTVLRDVNLTVNKGDVVVLVGPSGCGKSTFLRCLNRLEEPTGGEVLFMGQPVNDKDIDKVRAKMGMGFQHFNLFPHLTVKKNITLAPVKLGLMKQEEADARALELLGRIGLADKADTYPNMLSGGQKQRLSIARAIAKNPKIYIFDDSFSALDLKTDAALRKALASKVFEATVIIVAQRISTVMNADQIIVMEEGHIAGKGTHEELMRDCDVYRQIAKSQLSAKELGEEV